MLIDPFLWKTKVREQCMALTVEDNVIRLKVPKDNIFFVKVLQSKYDLSQVDPSLILRKSFKIFKKIIYLSESLN